MGTGRVISISPRNNRTIATVQLLPKLRCTMLAGLPAEDHYAACTYAARRQIGTIG
jgi:hypothetical protein